MHRITRLAVVVLGIAFCVWVYFAPHLTVRSMRLAAARGDAEALAAHVDFTALRGNIKTQLADSVSERIGEREDIGAFSGWGARLATAVAGPMIDAMVSPQALSLMFASRELARDGLEAVADDGGRPSSNFGLPQWQATMAYEDFDTFVVTLEPDGDFATPAKLIFKRNRLLWWKLSAIPMSRE